MYSNRKTLKEYARGIVGGLLFSLPIIYTEEMWWRGFTAAPYNLILYIVATFLLLLGFNKYSGTRKGGSFLELCHESVEEIGLAFLTSFVFLLLISEITFQMSVMEILGKVVVESMAVAIGISVGTAELGQKNDDDQTQEDQESSGTSETGDQQKEDDEVKDDAGSHLSGLISLAILSLCGAVLFSSPVAPTLEIPKIAMSLSPIHQILLLILALILSIVITYFSDFIGSKRKKTGVFEMILHTMIGLLAAISSSFFLLWFFGRINGHEYDLVIAQVIVLSIPGIIGASAGRLLIKA